MTLGTVLSRATGVVRIAVIAAALGIAETRLTDAYNLANMVPNIIYELVLGGVVSSIFVPLFVEVLEKESFERRWEVFSAVLNVSLVILSIIAVVGVLAAPLIADFYAGRLQGSEAAEQQRVITFLLRLFIPQIVLYGLYFVVAGLLNAHKRFGPPMFTPIINNLVVIAAFLLFSRYGTVTLSSVTTPQLLLIGLGTTLSVAPMGLVLIPYLRRIGRYRPTLSLDHPSFKRLGRLAIFVVGFVAANQVGYVVIQWLANAQQGGYSAYISAFTFFLLPVGLFMWSLTTALMPDLTSHALNERWGSYREQLSIGLRATIFLMVPCAVGFFVLAEPMVRVLLQHGVVTGASTDLVAAVLRYLVLGLVQFSLFQLLVRGFYGLQDTKTPFLVNCGVIALSIGINIPMFGWLGVPGLAAGQAISYTIGVAALVRRLVRRVGALEVRRLAASLVRVLAASAAMGVIVYGVASLPAAGGSSGVLVDALVLAGAVAAGAASYLGASYLLGVEELRFVRSAVARRKTPVPSSE